MSAVPPVILRASQKHTATLIFLHGLGDTGVGWAGALNTIRPPYMKVVCPTANIMPVTLNAGFAMPAWYDILSLDEHDSGKREDMEGVEEARDTLEGIVAAEAGDVPRNRIMVGGFSQGGAVALYTALKSCDRPPLAGCIALSAYVPGSAAGQTSLPMMADGAKVTTPILQCHGEADEVVPVSRGRMANEILRKYADDLQFRTYAGMGHEATLEELELVKDFIHKCTASYRDDH